MAAWSIAGWSAAAVALALACTSSSEPAENGVGGASDAGGSGGALGGGGSAGSISVDGGDPPASTSITEGDEGCQVPSDATALCLTFSPESIAPEAEPGLDQRGVLTLEIFDTPSPPSGDAAAAAALYRRTYPAGDADAEIALADLPAPTLVLNEPRATLYVRALFFDHEPSTDGGGISWGTWVGGLDVSRGLAEDTALTPVRLTEGTATHYDVPLMAFRRLVATVTTSVTPLGDGEGALSVMASRIAALPPEAPTHGYGIDPCVDVTQGPQPIEMVLLGAGRFFVTGYFDDLGIETPGAVPPGTLLTVDPSEVAAGTAIFDEVTFGDEQYSATVSIDLAHMSSTVEDPSTLGPNSCADLGLPGTP